MKWNCISYALAIIGFCCSMVCISLVAGDKQENSVEVMATSKENNREREHWFMDKRFAYKEDGCLIYIVDTQTHKQYLCTKYGGIMEIK